MLRKKIGGECVNFQDVFRDLVQLSESGLKEIGEYMGYESSYISKWHSGKNCRLSVHQARSLKN